MRQPTRHLFALLLFLAGTAAAWAADASRGSVIGFSPDGQMFAFEQFGMEDGSGFSYSEIFLVDLAKDSWAPGTPVRVRLEDESATLKQARETARMKAKPLLDAGNISIEGEVLAFNPPTEVVADRRQIAFDLAYWATAPAEGPRDYRYELVLTEKIFPARSTCPVDPETKLVGFALTISQSLSKTTMLLHEDTSLPESRGCTLAYDIDSVISPEGLQNPPYLVAIIGVYSFGFEGADRRLIAVPVKLP